MEEQKDIGEKLKEDSFAKSSAYMFSSRISIMVLGFFTHLINTRLLGPELYGILAVYMSIISILGGIETGLSAALTKYLSEFQAKKNRLKSYSIFKTSFMLETILVALFVLFFLPIAYSNNIFVSYKHSLFFVVAILITNVYLGFLGSSLIALKRIKLFSIIRLLGAAFYLFFIVILIYFLDFKLYGALTAFFLSILICTAINWFFLCSLSKNVFQKNHKLFYKDILIYAFPITVAALFSNIIVAGGPVIFNFLSGNLTKLGYFAVLVALGNRGRQLLISISKTAFPYISAWHAKGQNKKIMKLIIWFTLCIIFLILLMTFILFHVGDSIVNILYGEKYASVSKYLILTCLVFLIVSLKDFITMVLNSIGKPGKNLIGILFAFIIFFISLVSTHSSLEPTFAILLAIGASHFIFTIYGSFVLFGELR